MKIKTDFVTNSSSTSFILACKGDFTFDKFIDLIGAKTDSPMMPLFNKLFELIEREMKPITETEFKEKLKELHPNIAKKLKRYKKLGETIYEGSLSANDDDPVETMFCMDSFEVENENIYLNYLECVW